MDRTKKLRTLLVAGVISLANNFALATDENCIEKHSQAWCLLDLASLSKGAREVPLSDLKDAFTKSGVNLNTTENSVNKGDLVMSGISYLDAGVLSNFFSAGWFFLAFNNNKPVGSTMQFFVILPKSEIIDNNPRLTAEQALMNAILKQFKIEQPAALKEYEHKHFFGTELRREYTFFGGRCGDIGCEYRSTFVATSGLAAPKILDKTPSWIGGNEVHIWTSYFPNVRLTNSIQRTALKIEDYPGLMKNLPKWFYLYQPGDTPFILNSEGVMFLVKK